ncbi:MAG: YDG domain-containing protein, partial [Alphaproteobacteria bacterium]|nr:YDG domain-containing protein [Alphaproteobacteria bacterium]
RGNAYLYNLGTGAWTDLATTAGQPITALASSSSFGYAVALNDNYAFIGAYGVSSTRGTAYLYNLGTGAWTDLATTAGQPITGLASSSSFGYAVALSDTYALIGATGLSSYRGNAYLYNLGTGAWTDLATTAGQPITALAGSSYFGYAVALNNTYAFIGAYGVSVLHGNAYFYNLGTGAWSDLSSWNKASFGTAVALSDSYALIGAPDMLSGRGTAYLYDLESEVWTDLAATVNQPITTLLEGSNFGNAVAVNDNYALIGASGASSGQGNAYLYNLVTGAWTNLAATAGEPVTALAAHANFAGSVALNGSSALIGASGVSSGQGNAYLYNLVTGAWTNLAATAGEPVTALAASSLFGSAVALNDNYALIGASGAVSGRGTAYFYNLGTGSWTDLAATAGEPVTVLTANSNFGISVALNNNYALIGASGVASNQGNAYLYKLVTGVWTDLAASTGQPVTALAASSLFGASVALNESYALIGASGVASNRGNAYLYNLGTTAWTDLSTLSGQPITSLGANIEFGKAVALNDDYALIGAPGVGMFRGNAYLLIVESSGMISSATIQTALASGNVVITADNRITINRLQLTNANAGNSLTLQAGGNIMIYSDVVLGGRTAIFLANASSSALGDSTLRQDGTGGITLDTSRSIDNAGGDLTLKIGTASSTERTGAMALAGDFALGGDITAETLLIDGSESAINVSGNLSVTGAGTSLILNGREINLTGAGTLSAVSGRWMVYNAVSASLGTVALGALSPTFYRYGCTYAGGCTTGATVPGVGNGVVYAYAPTLTISGMDTITKVYNQTTAIDISGASLSGFVNGNTATLAANFNDKNVENDKAVGYELSTAYGYLLTGGAGTGSITPASLSATSLVANNKIYDATVAATLDVSGAVLTGVYGGDTVTVVSGAGTFADKNVELGKAVTATSVVLGGIDGGNYAVTGFTTGLTADIAAKEITYAMSEKTINQGETSWGTETLTGFIGGDSVSTSKKLVMGGGGLLDLDATTPVGDYAQRIIGLIGDDASNYLLAAFGNSEGLLHIILPAETSDVTSSAVNILSNLRTVEGSSSGKEELQTETDGSFGFLLQQKVDRKDADVLVLYWNQTSADQSGRNLLADIQKYAPDVVSIKGAITEDGQEVSTLWLLKAYEVGSWLGDQSMGKTLTVMVEGADGKLRKMKVHLVNEEKG